MSAESVTSIMGRWIADWSGGTGVAREKARMAFCDAIACMLAGQDDAGARAVRSAIASWGEGACTVPGRATKAPAPCAALANGMAAHALDYDDGIHLGPVHASAVLVPALLALGEERKASGRAILDAHIAGIEIIARTSLGVGPGHYRRGWHPTSTFGTIGAAAACARLLGLDAKRATNAIGIAVSMASGVKAQFGSMSKPFHAGMAAQNGVQAAVLAEAGMTAGRDPLNAPMGFRAIYGDETSPGWSGLSDSIGAPLAIDAFGLGYKFYPWCRATHRGLDGLLALKNEHGDELDAVASVTIEESFSAKQNLMYPDPADEMQARFSMQYCGMVALDAGRVTLADFTPEAIRRPRIRRAMPSLDLIGAPPSADDENLTRRAPARIRVALKDGRVLERSEQHALGTPHKPMTAEQALEKFRDCADKSLSRVARENAERALRSFGDLPNVDDLMRCLA